MADNGNGQLSDKTPLQSKKFVAYLVAEATWKALAVLAFVWAWNLDQLGTRVFMVLLAIVLVAGFIEVGYILGQASLDKYTRLAQIAINGNGKMNGTAGKVISKATKGLIEVHPPEESPKPLVFDEGEPADGDEPEAKE